MARGQARDRDSNSNLDAPLGEQARPGESLQSPLSEPLATIGLIALVLPLFFRMSMATGAATRGLDYAAICGGLVADACGSLLLVRLLTHKPLPGSPPRTPVRLLVALGISVLGIVHLLRGLGVIKLGLLG